jgi:hypothetical protein
MNCQVSRLAYIGLLVLRLKMIASAEGKGFYEWLKEDLSQTCPDEQTLIEMLADIRRGRSQTLLSRSES